MKDLKKADFARFFYCSNSGNTEFSTGNNNSYTNVNTKYNGTI